MNTITTADGTEIYYDDWGTGHPSCSAMAGRSVPMHSRIRCSSSPREGYRCIAHDRRGHGRSSQPWQGNDLDTYADDLAELVAHLGLEKRFTSVTRQAAAR